MSSSEIRLALTHGDPAGIGPEVLVKALARWPNFSSARVLVLSRAFLLNALARKFRLAVKFTDIFSPENWETQTGCVPCYFEDALPLRFSKGFAQKALTVSAVRSIELAVRLAMEKKAHAVVTAPINKAGLKKAGFDIPGHTEYLAKLSGTKKYEMMLVGGPLRVVLVTRHVPIKKVPSTLTRQRVTEAILLTDRELRRVFGVRRPKIVVCGLNPHAGEEGTIGREEIDIIRPAVKKARIKTDAEIVGPLSPDVLFYDAYEGRYDAQICMYHDQGLIPLKMISRGHGVNVTLGLPFIRTSPDHGTAYDIAHRGLADPGSMTAALETAFQLAKNLRLYDRR
jgi:4-hydroxythreonine-4-phosphate dehydrogenase